MADWTNTPVTFPNPIAAAKSFLCRAAAQRNNKRALRALKNADDRILQDLGITRDEVTRAVGHGVTPMSDAELTFRYGVQPKR